MPTTEPKNVPSEKTDSVKSNVKLLERFECQIVIGPIRHLPYILFANNNI